MRLDYNTTYSNDCSFPLLPGHPCTFTISNHDLPPYYVQNFRVVTDITGGPKKASDFTAVVSHPQTQSLPNSQFAGVTKFNSGPYSFNGVAGPDGKVVALGRGEYAVTENPDPAYNTTYSADCKGTVTDQSAKASGGQFRICTITNYYSGTSPPTPTPTSTTPGTTTTSPTTTTPATMPGNQTRPTNSSAGLQTFYVFIHMNNQGGGTKTAKDAIVSWPTIFNGEPCGITATQAHFSLTPSVFPGSETGTPVKVSANADFCASPGTSLDFGNGYQEQFTVNVKIPGTSTTLPDCEALPTSGACHITLNYMPTSTGTTNNPTPLGSQKPHSTTLAKMTPSTHPGATTNTNNNNNPTTTANTNTNTNTNTNKNTNTNTNTNLNTNTNTNANINTNTIINRQTIQNTVKINNEVNNVIRTTSQAATATATTTTTSPSSKGPLVDLETLRLGKSIFPSGGIRPLADVNPWWPCIN
jgi:hypothetical protein